MRSSDLKTKKVYILTILNAIMNDHFQVLKLHGFIIKYSRALKNMTATLMTKVIIFWLVICSLASIFTG